MHAHQTLPRAQAAVFPLAGGTRGDHIGAVCAPGRVPTPPHPLHPDLEASRGDVPDKPSRAPQSEARATQAVGGKPTLRETQPARSPGKMGGGKALEGARHPCHVPHLLWGAGSGKRGRQLGQGAR